MYFYHPFIGFSGFLSLLLILLVIFLLWKMFGKNVKKENFWSKSDSEEILKERFVRGEIDEKELEYKLRTLRRLEEREYRENR